VKNATHNSWAHPLYFCDLQLGLSSTRLRVARSEETAEKKTEIKPKVMRISVFGIAWFKREEYDAIKRLFIDGDGLPATYDEWLKAAERIVDKFTRDGQAFRKVHIDPYTFPAWCAARGLEINTQARVRFSTERAAGIYDD
jgi:hypothetical protein